MSIINPRSVPILRHDGHLPAVQPAQLAALALRQRFIAPPIWLPEIEREPRFGEHAPADAAVLIAVVQHAEPTVLLTQRPLHMKTHAGQIAFPGGKVDAGDSSAEQAALREAQEEVGLSPSAVEVLGCLPKYLTGTMFSVTPVLGLVQPGMALQANPDEVSDVFEVPLAFLMNPANHRWHELEHQGVLRRWISMPYQDAATERYIWGATAGMLRNLYAFLRA